MTCQSVGKGFGIEAGRARQAASPAACDRPEVTSATRPSPTRRARLADVLDGVQRAALVDDAIFAARRERSGTAASPSASVCSAGASPMLRSIRAAAHDDARRHAAMKQAGGMPYPIGNCRTRSGSGRSGGTAATDAAAQHDDGLVAAGRRLGRLGTRLVFQRLHQGIGHGIERKHDELRDRQRADQPAESRQPEQRSTPRRRAGRSRTPPMPAAQPMRQDFQDDEAIHVTSSIGRAILAPQRVRQRVRT